MCRMAHLGNCDPETADQEYCIFHKPNKNEEEAREFYNKFVLRFFGYNLPWNKGWVFAKPIDARGFVFPRGFHFDCSLFESDVDFSEAVFEFRVSFMECVFNGNSEFMAIRFKKGADFSFVIFNTGTSFSGSVFGDKVYFDSARFHCSSKKSECIDFSAVTFEKEAWFHESAFMGPVHFGSSVFSKEADFQGSTFKGYVKLYNITFKGNVDFSGCTFQRDFVVRNSEFSGKAIFGGATFGVSYIDSSWVSFWNVQFKKDVNFSECVFKLPLDFQNVKFGQDAENECNIVDFSASTFEAHVKFYDVTFDCPASFEETTFELYTQFGRIGSGEMIYCLGCDGEYVRDTDSPVLFKDIVDFSASTFNGYVAFDGAIFNDATFEGVSFNEPVSFSAKPSNFDYKFHGKLDFSNVDIRKGISIDIPSEWFKLPEAEIEARRVQRLSYEKEGKRDEADRMFVLEMRAKRRARIKNARTKLEKLKAHTHNFVEWLLADLPSEYGTNWVRLFLFSLLVIIGNAIPYTIWSAYIEGFPQTPNYFIRFANALYYSLVTFTTLGYGDMHPTGWLKALSALEALTGAVFMALVVAVIARKWMR